MAVEFRVLGPLEVHVDARNLDIGAAKQRGLLALLLLNADQVVGRDRLIEDLWEGSPPPAARASLQSYVYRLRGHLRSSASNGSVELCTQPAGYLLKVPADMVDLHRFERLASEGRQALDLGEVEQAAGKLRSAVDIWRGDAYEDIDLRAVRDEARRLDERRLDVIEQWLAAELDLGRHQPVISVLDTLTAAHPLRERPWEMLMTAQYRSGRRADALDTYQRLYRLLDEELAVRPSRPVRDLHLQILRGSGESGLAPSRRETSHPSPPAPPPRQLPGGPGEFTGREDELRRLDALLAPGVAATTVTISAIAGTAGIGKTALALQWARRVAGWFPDGQLYVNLRGFDPTGATVSPADAVRGFLDALHVPRERIPGALDAQIGLYRSLLAGRRVLVVLDNARDSAQVRALLPGSPGCVAVVTSRNRLTGLVATEGAYPLTLDLLSQVEARQFLVRRLGAERVEADPEAVDQIVHSCARLPLALAVVAARAAIHPDFPLRALARELTDAGSALDALHSTDPRSDLRRIFSWSYDLLSPQAAALFRCLGWLPGPELSVSSAASVAGVGVPQVRPLLAELCETHLLTERSPGRYTTHDLLRAYAVERAGTDDADTDRREALHRLLDHYLHSATAAATILYPHRNAPALVPSRPGAVVEAFDGRDEVMRWFAREHASLLAAVQSAADSGFDTHAWQLAWALVEFLDPQGHWHDMAATQRTALAAARRQADLVGQALAHRGLASAYARLGRRQEAAVLLRRALDLYSRLGDRAGQGHTYRNLAWLAEQDGDRAMALAHAERALHLYYAIGHRVGMAAALNDVGWHHARLGNHRRTLSSCRWALALLQELGNRHGQAATWESLGYAYLNLGDPRQAIACFRESLGRYRTLGVRYYEGETLIYLGDAYQAAGDDQAAAHAWRSALEVLEQFDHPDADRVRRELHGFPGVPGKAVVNGRR